MVNELTETVLDVKLLYMRWWVLLLFYLGWYFATLRKLQSSLRVSYCLINGQTLYPGGDEVHIPPLFIHQCRALLFQPCSQEEWARIEKCSLAYKNKHFLLRSPEKIPKALKLPSSVQISMCSALRKEEQNLLCVSPCTDWLLTLK